MRLLYAKDGESDRKKPTGLLLLPQDRFEDNLVIQCLNISINTAGNMGVASTRVAIATTRQPDTRTSPQRRAGWTGSTTDVNNDGVGWYQR